MEKKNLEQFIVNLFFTEKSCIEPRNLFITNSHQ